MDQQFKALIDMTDLTQNKPLKDIVYENFHQAIITGILPAGRKINQKLLADYLNVSRTPIRLAIDRLKQENLLKETEQGVVVNYVSAAAVSEIFKLRHAFEPLVVTNAMQIMQQDDFDALDQLMHKTLQANTARDLARVNQYCSDYNRMIFHHAQMPHLEIMIEQVKGYLTRFRTILLRTEARRTQTIFEQTLIVHCMKTKDEQLAKAALKEHLDTSEQFILTQLAKDKQYLANTTQTSIA